MEGRRDDDVVVDGPQRVVAEALVEVPYLLGGQADGPQVHAVLIEGGRGFSSITGPAHPGPGVGTHHRLHRGHETSGTALPVDVPVLVNLLVDGEAVRRDDEVEGIPGTRHRIISSRVTRSSVSHEQ
jgi:hypothetical protein